MKLAAIEAMRDTEPAPAAITAIGGPDVAARKTYFAVRFPGDGHYRYALARSYAAGHQRARGRDRRAHTSRCYRVWSVQKLRADRNDKVAKRGIRSRCRGPWKRAAGQAHHGRSHAAPRAGHRTRGGSTIPNVPVLFWSFRIMVACGLWFIVLFGFSFWLASDARPRRASLVPARRLVQPALAVACCGARLGRRRVPAGALGHRRCVAHALAFPVSTAQAATSLAGFVIFYTALAVVDLMLLRKYIRKPPKAWACGEERPARFPAPQPRRRPTQRPCLRLRNDARDLVAADGHRPDWLRDHGRIRPGRRGVRVRTGARR